MHGTSMVSSWEGGRPGLPVCSSWGQAVQYLDQKKVSQVPYINAKQKPVTHRLVWATEWLSRKLQAPGSDIDKPTGQKCTMWGIPYVQVMLSELSDQACQLFANVSAEDSANFLCSMVQIGGIQPFTSPGELCWRACPLQSNVALLQLRHLA